MRLVQRAAPAPTTDARLVSITSTGMDIEMGTVRLKNRRRGTTLFQGIDGLEGCLAEDTGGALQPVACVVAPSARGQEDGDYPY